MSEDSRQITGNSDDPDPPAAAPSGLLGRLRAAWDNRALRFVFLFLLYLGIATWSYPELRDRYRFVIQGLMTGTAHLEYWLFRPFTDDVSVTSTMIMMKGFAVKIIEECTGVYEAIIFGSAVVAFPTSWAKRAIGLFLGIPLIYAFNAIRIAVLMIVGRFYPASFEFMHLYFWQATLIVMITSVWALWIFKVVIREPPPASST